MLFSPSLRSASSLVRMKRNVVKSRKNKQGHLIVAGTENHILETRMYYKRFFPTFFEALFFFFFLRQILNLQRNKADTDELLTS